jgi:hypothetical protein
MNLLIGLFPCPSSVLLTPPPPFSLSWCLPEGNYRLKLFDKKLFESRRKHAAIRVSKTHVDEEGSTPAPYISGSGSIYFSLGEPSIAWVSTVDWYTQIGFYALIAVVVTVVVVYYIRYRGGTESGAAATTTAGERSPLISRPTATGTVELSHA